MIKILVLRIVLLLTFTVFQSTAFAAGSDNDYGTASKMPASYLKAVKVIKLGEFQTAIQLLKSADNNKPNDANINNLLGFAHRKIGDLVEAGAYYRKALSIDGKHKGALEYQGELFLKVGNKAAAQKNLEKLDKICWLGCSELDDLEAAIKNHKS